MCRTVKRSTINYSTIEQCEKWIWEVYLRANVKIDDGL